MTRIAVNSTVLYVIAFLLTTIVHEFSHAMFGLFLGSGPVLHHTYVEHLNGEAITTAQSTIIASAGPLISLIQGVIASVVFFRIKKYGLLQLLIAWVSVLGFINFLGYVMTGPIFQVGDVGRVYQMQDTPLYLQILFAIVAAVALVILTLKMSRPFLRLAPRQEWLQSGHDRKKTLFNLIILPWIFGSLVATALYLPVIAVMSIIYPVMSGFVFIGPWQNGERITGVMPSQSTEIEQVSIKYISVLVLLSLIFKFVLQPGIIL